MGTRSFRVTGIGLSGLSSGLSRLTTGADARQCHLIHRTRPWRPNEEHVFHLKNRDTVRRVEEMRGEAVAHLGDMK